MRLGSPRSRWRGTPDGRCRRRPWSRTRPPAGADAGPNASRVAARSKVWPGSCPRPRTDPDRRPTPRGTVAICGGLAQALHADHVQVARHLVVHGPRRDRVLLEHTHERFHRGAKRRMTRNQVVEDGAQGIDVHGQPGLIDVSRGLLRGHVAWRSKDLSGNGELLAARSVRLARPKSVI